MVSKRKWSVGWAILALALIIGPAQAQIKVETDPRFEKLAQDLYPKAKQEGAIVVYTIWDVEHIRSILEVFNKRFPGINTTYWQGTRSEIIARTLTEYQGTRRPRMLFSARVRLWFCARRERSSHTTQFRPIR